MVWSALAYNQGKLVKPIWDSKVFNFQTTESELSFSETHEPTLIWDMRGIIKNRPDPFPLPFSPKDTYLDCGLKWGEDIIDLIMADRGTVVLLGLQIVFRRGGLPGGQGKREHPLAHLLGVVRERRAPDPYQVRELGRSRGSFRHRSSKVGRKHT